MRPPRTAPHIVRAAGLAAGLAVAVAATCPAAAAETLRGVVGYGAAPSAGMTGGGRMLLGTVGQPVVGASTGRVLRLCHGFWCTGGMTVVSVDQPTHDDRPLPTVIDLGHAVPNPTRASASFVLALPRTSVATIRVYDVQGRVVSTVLDRALDAGYHAVRWEPSLGAGVYFARLTVNGIPADERRVVVLK